MTGLEQLQEGLGLMFLGMGSVFVFLAILVTLMSLIARISEALGSEPEEATSPRTVPAPAPKGPDQQEVAAVISAAVHRYRASHGH